jgi:hypothetical protein
MAPEIELEEPRLPHVHKNDEVTGIHRSPIVSAAYDQPLRQSEPMQVFLNAVLFEAVNEVLKTPVRILRQQERMPPPPEPSEVTDYCDKPCPLIDYLREGDHPDKFRLAKCNRFKALMALEDYPAWPWMLSESGSVWSFKWVCNAIDLNPDSVLSIVRTLPRGAIKWNGKRVYLHNLCGLTAAQRSRPRRQTPHEP